MVVQSSNLVMIFYLRSFAYTESLNFEKVNDKLTKTT